jgi:hypothetical protein
LEMRMVGSSKGGGHCSRVVGEGELGGK